MNEVAISVTVSRTDIDNQFKGLITFKSETREISFDYLCTDPDNTNVDLEFSNENEKFEVKGAPVEKLFEKLNDNQKFILAISSEPLFVAISNTQKFSLSQKSTNLLRMSASDISGQMNFNANVGKKEYIYLFGN